MGCIYTGASLVMRILLVTADMSLTAGGPPQVVAGSAKSLAERGHHVTVYSLAGTPSEFTGQFDSIQIFARDAPGTLGSSRELRRAVEQNLGKFDLIHVHGVWEKCAADAARLFRDAGKPVVVSPHGMLGTWSMRQSRWKKWLALRLLGTRMMLRRADRLIFASHDERKQALQIFGHASASIVPNGVDANHVGTLVGSIKQFELSPSQPKTGDRTLLYLSRIHPQKGLDLLIATLSKIRNEFPQVRLMVVGIPQDKKFLAKIRRQVAELQLEDRIIIITDVSGTRAKAMLGMADIFVLPSHQEGFSMALLEALASGTPVLITDKCHFPDVQATGAGLVVSNTEASLEAGLRTLLSLSDARLKDMGKQGAQLVAEGYDWRAIARQLESLYSSVIRRSN